MFRKYRHKLGLTSFMSIEKFDAIYQRAAERKGGEGAGREFCETILAGQNKLQSLQARFF